MVKTWKGRKKSRKRFPVWKSRLERFIRKKMVNPLLNATRDHDAGKISKAEYENIRDSLPLTYKVIMDSIGMDYNGRRDYGRVQGYFSEMRKELNIVMEIFINSGEYQKYKDAGESDAKIFYRFILAAMSYGVFPFYADRDDDWKLKPLERADYLFLLQQRLEAISTEVERRAKEVTTIDKQIPIKGMISKPALKDGVLFKLPPSTAVRCPYTGCKEEFSSDAEFVKHIDEKHTTEKKTLICPNCISGELKQMEGGDFRCTKCHQIYDRDEILKFLGK